MNNTAAHRTLAIAGVFQAALLVQQVARRGSADESAVAASLNSLLQLDPDNAAAVFGGIQGADSGLKVFTEQMDSKQSQRDPELLRYVIGLLHLERRLAGREDLLHKIRDGLETLAAHMPSHDPINEHLIATLALLYQDTISTLTPRLIVHGEPLHLADFDKANLVRALLLAGIRAAVLWRQCGGRRWRLLLQRSEMLRVAQRLRAPRKAE